MRRVHGRICREQDINLLLHLQHLSEEPDCKDEWMFVESRPIEADEHHICPCGQNNIQQVQRQSHFCGFNLYCPP